MRIEDYFISGDVKGAIEFMRSHAEFADVLAAYVARFERAEYAHYDIPDALDRILLAYQVYFRNVFYCKMPEKEAAQELLAQLRELLALPNADEDALAEKMTALFASHGYHAQFGDTQGYYGPYIWRETIPTVYQVELPDGVAEYTVNLLRGFVFRSWMDYLTFGSHGTGGWASKDGTLNCVESAYDFQGERFLVSFLKHEAQHAVDLRRYPSMTAAELEYRAKLVELCYSGNPNLLGKFLSEADESRHEDGHAMASARLQREFSAVEPTDLSAVQARALALFQMSDAEIDKKYKCK